MAARSWGEPMTPSKKLKTKKIMMAERVGFEPTCRLPDNTLSRRARYDHFGTSPVRWNSLKRTHDYTADGRRPGSVAVPHRHQVPPVTATPVAVRHAAP